MNSAGVCTAEGARGLFQVFSEQKRKNKVGFGCPLPSAKSVVSEMQSKESRGGRAFLGNHHAKLPRLNSIILYVYTESQEKLHLKWQDFPNRSIRGLSMQSVMKERLFKSFFIVLSLFVPGFQRKIQRIFLFSFLFQMCNVPEIIYISPLKIFARIVSSGVAEEFSPSRRLDEVSHQRG